MNSSPLLLTPKKFGGRILSLVTRLKKDSLYKEAVFRKVDFRYEREVFKIYDGKIWNG